MSSSNNLLFTAPQSSFDPSFWEELYHRKLNQYGLNTDDIHIRGFFFPGSGESNGYVLFNRLSLSLEEDYEGISIPGTLRNVNTIEDFGRLDKKQILTDCGSSVLDCIVSGEAIANPALLHNFQLITFADLKSYKFVFWFGMPAVSTAQSWELRSSELVHGDETKAPLLQGDVLRAVYERVLQQNTMDVFVVERSSDVHNVLSLREAWEKRYSSDLTFVLLDMSSAKQGLGWNVRNLLTLLTFYAGCGEGCSSYDDEHFSISTEFKSIKLLSIRNPSIKHILNSHRQDFDLEAVLKKDQSLIAEIGINSSLLGIEKGMSLSALKAKLAIVGWEPNERGKAGPRAADLRATLDSKRLMAQAVDLNLRLMKWRMWPELNTDKLFTTKVLLVGAGTLGCSVARTLIGWGIRNITFVDNGLVSYSNPVRQSLFEFEDCQERKFKAIAAAERLRKIFPEINAVGIVLNIPMPGHPYATYNDAKQEGLSALHDEMARTKLEELINAHDYVFTLTDSREARWLPTVICAAKDKHLINVALGFDTFLVMRHSSLGEKLGCYFCNDIVAAGNSQRERPLDQQCTVTRPGLSNMAGALAVELMIAMIHYDINKSSTEEESKIPHQIRGSVLSFSQMLLETPPFPHCTACSTAIVESYNTDPSKFLRDVCAEPKLLEAVSGVEDLLKAVNLDLCVDSDEDF